MTTVNHELGRMWKKSLAILKNNSAIYMDELKKSQKHQPG
jgi:hypothetical protein